MSDFQGEFDLVLQLLSRIMVLFYSYISARQVFL